MVICRISRAEPRSATVTPSWGNARVLVHMETAVSRLRQPHSFRGGIRDWVRPTWIMRPTSPLIHCLTVFSTVCMAWRPTFPLSFVYVFMLSVSQLTAGLLCFVIHKTFTQSQDCQQLSRQRPANWPARVIVSSSSMKLL